MREDWYVVSAEYALQPRCQTPTDRTADVFRDGRDRDETEQLLLMLEPPLARPPRKRLQRRVVSAHGGLQR